MAAHPRAVVGMYAFWTPDPQRLAAFWGALMDLPVLAAGPDLVMLDFDHEHGPVTWMFERGEPGPAPSNRLGLDLVTADDEDWRSVADRAVSLGAVLHGDHEQDGARWMELADPDGNGFRVFGPRPT